MVEGSIFIGAVIIAVTQLVKYVAPNVNGAVTIGVAVLVGLVVALLDKELGVTDITPAEGIMLALASVGVHSTVRQVSVGKK